jgi:hypothetical protein
MTHENDDKDREAAHRFSACVQSASARAMASHGLTAGATATGCLIAAVRLARLDMDATAVANWMRDVAEAVEAETTPPDCAGRA